jgi:hypothetical protein
VNVQKPTELASDFLERANKNKACALVEMEALGTTLGYTRNQGVVAETPCLLDDGCLE